MYIWGATCLALKPERGDKPRECGRRHGYSSDQPIPLFFKSTEATPFVEFREESFELSGPTCNLKVVN